MKSTKQLFNRPRSHYEPEITILARKRIADGRELLQYLSSVKHLVPEEFMRAHIETYIATDKAVTMWREILEEE